MSLKVSYDEKHDVLIVWTGEHIETSASCEQYDGFIVDFRSGEELDPVGFELLGAAELLAPVLEKMRKRAAAG